MRDVPLALKSLKRAQEGATPSATTVRVPHAEGSMPMAIR